MINVVQVPVYEEPSINYKKQDIPLYEDHSTEDSEAQYYTEDYVEEEMEGYGSSPVQESVGLHGEEEGEVVRYDEYREREEARAAALHNYYKQLRGEQPAPTGPHTLTLVRKQPQFYTTEFDCYKSVCQPFLLIFQMGFSTRARTFLTTSR